MPFWIVGDRRESVSILNGASGRPIREWDAPRRSLRSSEKVWPTSTSVFRTWISTVCGRLSVFPRSLSASPERTFLV